MAHLGSDLMLVDEVMAGLLLTELVDLFADAEGLLVDDDLLADGFSWPDADEESFSAPQETETSKDGHWMKCRYCKLI